MESFPEHPGLNLSIDSTSGMMWTLLPGDKATISYFTAQELRPHNLSPRQVHRFQPDWITGIVILGLILIAWANFFFPSRFRQVLMAPWSKRFLSLLTREGNLFTERMTIALSIVYLLAAALLVYEANDLLLVQKPFVHWPTILIFLFFMGVILVYWSVKILMVSSLGFIFKTGPTTREYIFNIVIFNIISGLLLIPLLIFIIYLKSGTLLYLSIFLMGILFLFRFYKGFMIGFSLRKFSYLFLFVYLCALEMLPLVILTKLFLSYYS